MPKKGTGASKKKTTTAKGGTAAKKPAGARSAAAPKKAQGAKPTKAAQPRPATHIYAAIIMLLLIVIVVLVNRQLGERGILGKLDPAKKTEPARPAAGAPQVKPGTDAPGRDAASDSAQAPAQADAGKRTIRLYLYSFNEKTEKLTLTPVTRTIETGEPVRDAIRELIKGPSAREERRGLLSAVPKNLRVNSVKTRDDTAIVDFNGAIEENANGSILLNRIDQIVYTATQFPGVKGVEITVNGKKKRFLGSDGLSLGGPLRRHR